jgi:hypothetical protein
MGWWLLTSVGIAVIALAAGLIVGFCVGKQASTWCPRCGGPAAPGRIPDTPGLPRV